MIGMALILALSGPAPAWQERLCSARRSVGVHGRRNLGGDVGAPLLDRFEAWFGAADRLGFAVEFVFGLVEIDLEPQRLRHIPRRVAEHFDAVAFGVAEIDRPGIAVAARVDDLTAGLAHFAEDALYIGECADVERHLLHHRGVGVGLAAAHQHHLVMVAGVATHKGDAAVGRGVADHETEHAGVKLDHLRHVAYIEPDMAQARRLVLRHCLGLLFQCYSRTSLLTTLSRIGLPSRTLRMFCTAATPMRSTASRVTPATCGAAMKFGRVNSGLSCGVGSWSKTSSAAPAMRFAFSTSKSAFSSMMPPRAVLTIKAVRFICASRAASNRPVVSGVFGQWIVMKSARATAASRSCTGS